MAAFFLHSARNFLRAAPCRPFASASFEHSTEAALIGAAAGLAGAAAAGAGAALSAKATPPIKNALKAAAVTRVMIFMVKIFLV